MGSSCFMRLSEDHGLAREHVGAALLTVRGPDQHRGQILELVLVKGQLILVPGILFAAISTCVLSLPCHAATYLMRLLG